MSEKAVDHKGHGKDGRKSTDALIDSGREIRSGANSRFGTVEENRSKKIDQRTAKDLKREYQRAWRNAHLEEIRKRNRENAKKNYPKNREKIRARENKRRREDPEKYLRWGRESYARHAEKRRQESRAYYHEHAEHLKKAAADARRKERELVLKVYGGRCACCGEARYEFLAIDHIAGGGTKHKEELGKASIVKWLRQNNFPSGFRVLCHNCNSAFGFYGYCPHTKRGSDG